ncbi:MAG: SIS domain-containing protein [Candidatus Brocadiia bacterium]
MANLPLSGDSDILAEATRVLRNESEAVASLIPRLNSSFTRAVRLILETNGKVILAGVGKSGLIASKIAATLSSTGTTAVFLHPTEGMHGDLGIVSRDDVVICISKSGETSELLAIAPVVRKLGASLIVMVGNTESTLARRADIVLDCTVRREACPLDGRPCSRRRSCNDLAEVQGVHAREFRPIAPWRIPWKAAFAEGRRPDALWLGQSLPYS